MEYEEFRRQLNEWDAELAEKARWSRRELVEFERYKFLTDFGWQQVRLSILSMGLIGLLFIMDAWFIFPLVTVIIYGASSFYIMHRVTKRLMQDDALWRRLTGEGSGGTHDELSDRNEKEGK